MIPHFEYMLAGPDDCLFLHGACHIFALALNQRFGYPLRLVHDTSATLPKGASHVFCAFDDSRGIDVVGLFNERELLIDKDWLPPRHIVLDISPSDLQRFATHKSGGGLYMDESFVLLARTRAFALIDRFADHYSGRNRTSIPELHRAYTVNLQTIFNDDLNA